ncbi:MAG: hypothetical protein KUG81_02060 [Gammaproteobacteria bacterium]|nr:hypothetical protein [Gammaproteobacteria bacterium]
MMHFRFEFTAKESFHFEQNPIFKPNFRDSHRAIIDERPCVTQISPGSDIEVQLVIGLDLGTSMTKVVIGDPDQKRFYAVPLSPESENPYLISTSILRDELHNIIIDTGDSPNVLRNIKLDLMEKRSNEAIIHLAGYVAQIVRHSIRWFCSEHADDYRGMHLFWTMAMGLPVDSARQPELESHFRIAAIAGAQAAISQESIAIDNLGVLVKQVEEDLINQKEKGATSCFEELGGDPGVVVVVPEIAAQMVGLFRSRRWERNKPISFLMDVGAGTVDSAVFSLVDAMQDGKELAFCAFTCNVSELGVIKLHQDRIDWLHENLPEDLPEREAVVAFLANLKRFNGASIAVPGNIDDYINHVEIVRGKSNLDPDRLYKNKLGDKVYQGVLQGAKRKSEGDSAWSSLRTMICGGGARSAFYREYIHGISKNSSFNLQLEALEKPNNLDAPSLPATEYDRLSVAYGLAQGTQWEYRWPESMEEIRYRKKDRVETFISKDMI